MTPSHEDAPMLSEEMLNAFAVLNLAIDLLS